MKLYVDGRVSYSAGRSHISVPDTSSSILLQVFSSLNWHQSERHGVFSYITGHILYSRSICIPPVSPSGVIQRHLTPLSKIEREGLWVILLAVQKLAWEDIRKTQLSTKSKRSKKTGELSYRHRWTFGALFFLYSYQSVVQIKIQNRYEI